VAYERTMSSLPKTISSRNYSDLDSRVLNGWMRRDTLQLLRLSRTLNSIVINMYECVHAQYNNSKGDRKSVKAQSALVALFISAVVGPIVVVVAKALSCPTGSFDDGGSGRVIVSGYLPLDQHRHHIRFLVVGSQETYLPLP
jgi:hypothetical protein